METILSVPDIRASFTNKPSSYAISTRPERDAVRNIRKQLLANLVTHHCDIDNSGGDMRFLVLRPDQWRVYQLYLSGIDPGDDAAVAAFNATLPPSPVVANPGVLADTDGWTIGEYTLANNKHTIKKQNFTRYVRYCTALLQDIQAAVPQAVIAQICDDDGHIQHRSPSEVLDYLEHKYRRMRPKEVAAIIASFDSPYEDSLTIDEYFHRQNRLIRKMQDTDEPISPARAIRTCLGHMQTLAHLKRACINWEHELTPTWNKFCSHFSDAVLQHEDHQDTLADAGLANLAQAETEFSRRLDDQAQHFYAQMATQRDELEDAFSARMDNASIPPAGIPTHVPIPPGTVAASALDSGSVFTAMQNQINELLAEKNQRNNGNYNGHNNGNYTGNNNGNNNNNRRGNNRRNNGRTGGRRGQPRTKRRWTNQNYCWTHGCDVDDAHTSASCFNKSPHHKDAATLSNRMGGSSNHSDLVS